MPREPARLYLGTGRYVIALEAATGNELWRTKLPHSSSLTGLVTILLKGDWIFAGAGGRAWALDRRTGAVLWENGLPQTGYNPVLFAMEGAAGVSSDAAAVAAIIEQQQRAAHSST